MKIIADSGATKTDWMIISGDNSEIIKTEGINPFHQTEEYINSIIKSSLVPQIRKIIEDEDFSSFTEIYFYGAGCLPEQSLIIKSLLSRIFKKAEIKAETDLMGAARALCGKTPGIACILGTGSNSCMYDGCKITDNISPLGYILGDEGSGAYLGKTFISDCLKRQLPEYLKDGLFKEYQLTMSEILNKVYKEPQANRFLSSITPYIYSVRNDPYVKQFLKKCFTEFFVRNIMNYDNSLKVSFTGSVAWYFQNEIKETALSLDIKTGIFMKEPIWGLKEFHKNQ